MVVTRHMYVGSGSLDLKMQNGGINRTPNYELADTSREGEDKMWWEAA